MLPQSSTPPSIRCSGPTARAGETVRSCNTRVGATGMMWTAEGMAWVDRGDGGRRRSVRIVRSTRRPSRSAFRLLTP